VAGGGGQGSIESGSISMAAKYQRMTYESSEARKAKTSEEKNKKSA